MCLGQAVFNLAIIVYLTFLRVDKQYLARLQTALLGYLGGVKIHHAHLRGYHHSIVLGDGIAGGAQAITVEQSASKAAIAEEQSGGAIPRLHQD